LTYGEAPTNIPAIGGKAAEPYFVRSFVRSFKARGSPALSLKISIRESHHVSIVDISGRIIFGDETTMLRDAVAGLVRDEKKKILLNLAEVSYIDSSGVGELVSSFISVRKNGGELKLVNLTQKVHDVLHVAKLYTVFDVKDDEFTAVKSFDYYFAK
jgi:anti-sigma B factor antagonist